MNRKGAFLISREIFENAIWTDVVKFRIFFYIVGNAVFSEEGVEIGGIHIKRGQLLRSFRNLSDDLQYIENRKVKKYSVSVISRKVEQLVKENRLKIESTELGTLFTVVNYDLHLTFQLSFSWSFWWIWLWAWLLLSFLPACRCGLLYDFVQVL